LCQQLIAGGVDAMHFYTLNRSKATIDVLQAMGIQPKSG